MEEALREEIKATLEFNHNGWAKKKEQDATICGAARHALMVGGRTKKVLEYAVCAKERAICKKVLRRKQTTVREHNCQQNYEGISKGMEASAALLLTKE
eukprot:14387006-Ditylum_brightwellii.AAC.1